MSASVKLCVCVCEVMTAHETPPELNKKGKHESLTDLMLRFFVCTKVTGVPLN